MDGLLLIDKPAGWTSHDVVAKLRGILNIKRIGHAGTLDPFATGLLVIGIGKGTKKLTDLVGVDKEYEATIRLGATSDTFDVEGKILPAPLPASPPGREEVERALDKFRGHTPDGVWRGGYEQLAPLHSAKKIGGKKLYDLARAGKATEEMRPRKFVKIDELRMTPAHRSHDVGGNYEWPDLNIHVKCGSGTYIRSLADDIGRELGVGGYCLKLRRTRVGDFDVKDSDSIEGLTKDKALGSLKERK